jgi:hypothetical protein
MAQIFKASCPVQFNINIDGANFIAAIRVKLTMVGTGQRLVFLNPV